MKRFLVHGVYDSSTLKTLESFGVGHFAFDLRAKSPNLIPFYKLQELCRGLSSQVIHLIFENDRKETVLSFLDLLKDGGQKVVPIFRDQQDPRYYNDLDRDFYWMFHPEGDWRVILGLNRARGVLLPVKWQQHYQSSPELWDLIEARRLDVYLHAENFNETMFLGPAKDLNLSIELSKEVESGFRHVDQERLKNMKVWRKYHENSPL